MTSPGSSSSNASSASGNVCSGRLLKCPQVETEQRGDEAHLGEIRLNPKEDPVTSWTVGRNPLAEVSIKSVLVSRNHAKIIFDRSSLR